MGRKTNRKRQEQEEARQASLAEVLAHHPLRTPRRKLWRLMLTDQLQQLEAHWVRPPDTWKPPRTHQQSTLRDSFFRHLFCLYRTPAFLEVAALLQIMREKPSDDRLPCLTLYLTAAQGRSLYDHCTKGYLTHRATDLFLKHGRAGLSIGQNMCLAIALAAGADMHRALMLSNTPLGGRFPSTIKSFWRRVVTMFATAPELSPTDGLDLLDYLSDVHENVPGFSLKGRTVISLKRSSAEWHRQILDRSNQAQAMWTGAMLPDWRAEACDKDANHFIVRICQLKTTDALQAESEAMRHCVRLYAARCKAGQSSIWSMTREDAGQISRCLTLELNNRRTLLQARGFANRLPKPWEEAILRRWIAWIDRNSWLWTRGYSSASAGVGENRSELRQA